MWAWKEKLPAYKDIGLPSDLPKSDGEPVHFLSCLWIYRICVQHNEASQGQAGAKLMKTLESTLSDNKNRKWNFELWFHVLSLEFWAPAPTFCMRQIKGRNNVMCHNKGAAKHLSYRYIWLHAPGRCRQIKTSTQSCQFTTWSWKDKCWRIMRGQLKSDTCPYPPIVQQSAGRGVVKYPMKVTF